MNSLNIPVIALVIVATVGTTALVYKRIHSYNLTVERAAQSTFEQNPVNIINLTQSSGPSTQIGDGKIVVSGIPKIVDGDTINVSNRRVRLIGVDAIESTQKCELSSGPWDCGRESTAALVGLVNGQMVSCYGKDLDRYGRLLAHCSVVGIDLGRWLVSNGWAVAFRRYSTEYVLEEDGARTAKLGVWRAKFEYPWDWRRDHGR